MLQICDLKRQYALLKTDIDNEMQSVMASGHFIKGPILNSFEDEFAQYIGSKFAIGVNSGTDALFIALKALDIGPGDEVILPAMSYIATAEAVTQAGATPIFVDILSGTECINTALIESKITPQTRAIMPVHLHGYPCDMGALTPLAKKHGLKVIEDCAQSTGAKWNGEKTGAIGDVGCFSFFPTKNLGCAGDGGMITTSDPGILSKIHSLREHGCTIKNRQEHLGYNSRLDAIQAAILRVKLPFLDDWNSQRRALAQNYIKRLADLPITLPPIDLPNAECVFHHFIVHLTQRDQVQKSLYNKGIESLSYYPIALHQQKLYLQSDNDFPLASNAAKNNLALPLFPELTTKEQDYIYQTLNEVLIE